MTIGQKVSFDLATKVNKGNFYYKECAFFLRLDSNANKRVLEPSGTEDYKSGGQLPLEPFKNNATVKS